MVIAQNTENKPYVRNSLLTTLAINSVSILNPQCIPSYKQFSKGEIFRKSHRKLNFLKEENIFLFQHMIIFYLDILSYEMIF